jgi:hypothetical protein
LRFFGLLTDANSNIDVDDDFFFLDDDDDDAVPSLEPSRCRC